MRPPPRFLRGAAPRWGARPGSAAASGRTAPPGFIPGRPAGAGPDEQEPGGAHSRAADLFLLLSVCGRWVPGRWEPDQPPLVRPHEAGIGEDARIRPAAVCPRALWEDTSPDRGRRSDGFSSNARPRGVSPSLAPPTALAR